MENILTQVRDFADSAHDGQTRKYTPDRYIVHPIRVMECLRTYTDKLPILSAALLHDVLEDTPVTSAELADFLKSIMSLEDALTTLRLVEELTDVYVKAEYPHLNRGMRKSRELDRFSRTSPDAQTIKYADILDNSREIAVRDMHFAPRYLEESLAILKVAYKGNPKLREIAMKAVWEEFKKLPAGKKFRTI